MLAARLQVHYGGDIEENRLRSQLFVVVVGKKAFSINTLENPLLTVCPSVHTAAN
jgi:hypothetical protein